MKTASPAPLHLAALAFALGLAAPAFAQHHYHAQHATGSTPTQDAPTPDEHAQHDHGATTQATPAPASMSPREPIPAITADDLAAAFPAIDHHAMQHAPAFNHKVTFNRLEAWDAGEGAGQAWEGIAWFGTDTDRLWLRSEGERIGSHTESADLEALYGRSVSPWWDVVAGIRHDFRPGDARTWAAVGVQGMAPYRFEIAATAYVGEDGQVAANVEAEYTLRITNRLVLQPLVEVDIAAKDDPDHDIGRGVSGIEAGLRLRYEIRRRVAPYVGVVHERVFGDAADHRRAGGESPRDTRVVAGVRLWF